MKEMKEGKCCFYGMLLGWIKWYLISNGTVDKILTAKLKVILMIRVYCIRSDMENLSSTCAAHPLICVRMYMHFYYLYSQVYWHAVQLNLVLVLCALHTELLWQRKDTVASNWLHIHWKQFITDCLEIDYHLSFLFTQVRYWSGLGGSEHLDQYKRKELGRWTGFISNYSDFFAWHL